MNLNRVVPQQVTLSPWTITTQVLGIWAPTLPNDLKCSHFNPDPEPETVQYRQGYY
jgi:hypothetical protein